MWKYYRQLLKNKRFFSESPYKKKVSGLKVFGLPIIIYVSAGFIKGYLEKDSYHEIPAEVVNIQRESDNKQTITYRYTYNDHYLFEKTVEEDTSSLFFGTKKLSDYHVGEVIKVLNSKRNPQLSCLQLPIFQPLGLGLFENRKGIEIKYQHVPTEIKAKIVERSNEKEEREKWKERALLSKPKFEK